MKFLAGRGVDLDGLDVGVMPSILDAVVGCGVGDSHCDWATFGSEVTEVVVEELAAEGFAAGSLEIILGAGYGDDFAGGEDVVVVVDLGHGAGGYMEAGLGAISAG